MDQEYWAAVEEIKEEIASKIERMKIVPTMQEHRELTDDVYDLRQELKELQRKQGKKVVASKKIKRGLFN